MEQFNNAFKAADAPIRVVKRDWRKTEFHCSDCDKDYTMHTNAFSAKFKKLEDNLTDWCVKCVKRARLENTTPDPRLVEEVQEKSGHTIRAIYHQTGGRHSLVDYTCGNCENLVEKTDIGNVKNKSGGYCIKCVNDKNRVPFEDVKALVESQGNTLAMNAADYKSNKCVRYLCQCGNPEVQTATLRRLKNGSSCLACSKSRATETMKRVHGLEGNEGIVNIFQIPAVKEKIVATSLEKYGVRHAMHHPLIFHKAVKNGYRTKTYTLPDGRVVACQGYEPQALDLILKSDFKMPFLDRPVEASEIRMGADVKPIAYEFEGVTRYYYPDMHIAGTNVFIEVKSTYTLQKEFDKNTAKFNGMVHHGLCLVVIILDECGYVSTLTYGTL
jgi:hypothetical protein